MDSFHARTPEIMKIKELNSDLLVQYSCDEIQLVRQQAQSATASEISFNVKLPDPSAILHSTIWVKLRAQFSMDGNTGGLAGSRSCWQSYPERFIASNKCSDHIMFPAGVCPLQSKMFSNVSCSVNSVSFQARPSEILEPIMRMTIPGKIAGKVGLPYPDYYTKRVGNNMRMNFSSQIGNPGGSELYVPGDYEWKAYEKWRKQATEGDQVTYESDVGGAVGNAVLSPVFEFWEPLNLACFSCIPQVMEAASLPAWHPYRMSGVGIPNVNRLVINAQMGPNFAGNMCLAVSRGLRANGGWGANAACTGGRNISLHEITGVELFATVYKPPTLWTGASQSQYVIPTWACERWEENIPNGELAEFATETVNLSYHNFDQIPGAFVLFVGPDRNTKWSRIAGSEGEKVAGDADVAAQTGAAKGWKDKLMSSRMDKLLSIKQLRLSVNTRSDAFISTRGDEVVFDRIQLYNMTMRNIRKYNLGYAEFDLDMESWYDNYCCVILTIDDISAAIPSANVTTSCNLHGSVVVENRIGYPVNGANFAAALGYGNLNGAELPQEVFSVFMYSVFNNRAMVLTQVSGEGMTKILPPSYMTELKLGGRAKYVGRV